MGLTGARLGEVQLALREAALEGWLLYDYRGQNPLARRALGLGAEGPLERWFCWIPADGMPALVVHETDEAEFGDRAFDVLGYAGWSALRAQLERVLPRRGAVAMEWQRIAGQPALSRVDEGTAELVRSYGPRVVSSARLVDALLAPWSAEDEAAHAEALDAVRATVTTSLEVLGKSPGVLERDWLDELEGSLRARGLHLARTPSLTNASATFRATREAQPLARGAVYELLVIAGDAARTSPLVHHRRMFCVGAPTVALTRTYDEARRLREAALALLVERLGRGARVLGFEVDEHVRANLARLGSGVRMPHRTGHYLGWEAHSAIGCTFDSLDVHDTRELRDRHAVALHPGVHRLGLGMRASASVLRDGDALRVLDAGQDDLHVVPT